MMSPILILAAIAGLLALLSLIPTMAQFPLLNVSVLLLAICFFLK